MVRDRAKPWSIKILRNVLRSVFGQNLYLWFLCLAVCVPAQADYQAGLDAYNRGDAAMALAEWKAVASRPPESQGLAIYRESLYAIAMLYWLGEGVPQDFTVAAVWLKQAADINHPGAQVKLGYLYSTGQGVPRNYAEARRWFEMADAQGDPDARYNLDLLQHEGMFENAAEEAAPVVASLPPVEPQTTTRSKATLDAEAGAVWILQQDPEHYTIQVIALRSQDNLHAFITAHADWSPFAIFRPARNELPLWIMVQGDYADVETAREAVQRFPAGIQQRERLWIRKFGMVQGEVQ